MENELTFRIMLLIAMAATLLGACQPAAPAAAPTQEAAQPAAATEALLEWETTNSNIRITGFTN